MIDHEKNACFCIKPVFVGEQLDRLYAWIQGIALSELDDSEHFVFFSATLQMPFRDSGPVPNVSLVTVLARHWNSRQTRTVLPIYISDAL